MQERRALVNISKYAGSRYDLVQAGGGNSSVKLDDGTMLIKASGFSLSEVERDSGFSTVITKEIAGIVRRDEVINCSDKREREALTSALVKAATIDKLNRPSIETLLHSFLAKYTLHTHPIVVNKIVSDKRWREVLDEIFLQDDIVKVDYATPGIELALTLYKALENTGDNNKIIFLQNHGLIISSASEEEVYRLTEYVVEKIEAHLAYDLIPYRNCTKVTALLSSLGEEGVISYLSRDYEIVNALKMDDKVFETMPFCPDTLVYCGVKSVRLRSLSDSQALLDYRDAYYELPKVIIYADKLYIIAKNVKKAKEIEEVLKFHAMVLSDRKDEVNLLEIDELSYLSNWEAEKYRQNI